MKAFNVMDLALIPLRKATISKTPLAQQLNAACVTTSFRLSLAYSLSLHFCLHLSLKSVYLGSVISMMSQKIVSFSFHCVSL